MDSVNNLIEKIKVFLRRLNRRDDVFTVFIIILVGLGGFGLGRLSLLEENKEPVRIEYPISSNIPQGQDLSENKPSQDQFAAISGGDLVASVKGAKYHFPWCSGAQRIKEENKIWFATKEEAEKAGYGPAANCKGL